MSFDRLNHVDAPPCTRFKDEPTQLIPTPWRRHRRDTVDEWQNSGLTVIKDTPMDRGDVRTPSRKERAMRRKNNVALLNPPAPRAAHRKTCIRSRNRFVIAAVAFAVAAGLWRTTIASAENMHAKRQLNRPWHGYGFLPGYEPPEVITSERTRTRRPAYWYGGPGFYRGRWNGGGFGPCWTPTPIGPHWNCG
jgi:hypothetical protein